MSRTVRFAVLAALALGAVACGGGDGGRTPEAASPTGTPAAPGDKLNVQVASYDLAVGKDRRLIVGLLTPDNQAITGGTVRMGLFFLGADGRVSPQPLMFPTAEFLAVPGKAPDLIPSEPTVGEFAAGVGVYEAHVTFEQPGAYGLAVEASLADGSKRRGGTRFDVAAQTEVPAAGEPAPKVDNLTLASTGVPKSESPL